MNGKRSRELTLNVAEEPILASLDSQEKKTERQKEEDSDLYMRLNYYIDKNAGLTLMCKRLEQERDESLVYRDKFLEVTEEKKKLLELSENESAKQRIIIEDKQNTINEQKKKITLQGTQIAKLEEEIRKLKQSSVSDGLRVESMSESAAMNQRELKTQGIPGTTTKTSKGEMIVDHGRHPMQHNSVEGDEVFSQSTETTIEFNLSFPLPRFMCSRNKSSV